jgi:tetratricopeptide (TPR) repeat protein
MLPLLITALMLPTSAIAQTSAAQNSTPDRQQLLQQEVMFYQGKVKQQPDSGLELAALASAYWKLGRSTGAEQWLPLAETTAKQSLMALPFNNSGARLIVAQVAQARHDFAQAQTIANDVLKTQPNNSEARSILVTTAIATGQLQKAEAEVEKLVQDFPNLNNLTLKALLEDAQGKDSAAETFRLAIQTEEAGEAGGSSLARVLLGRHYYHRGDLPQAAKLYQAAMELSPGYPIAMLSMAALETRQGNYQMADRYYQKLLAEAPEGAYVYDHKIISGQARLQRLQGQSNLAALNQIVEMVSSDTNAFGHRRELAHVLLERRQGNDIQDALALMETEVKNRQDALTLAVYAEALAANNKLQAANQTWQRIFRSGVRNPGMYWAAADVAEKLGDMAQAKTYRSQAMAIDPSYNSTILMQMGMDSV